MVILQMRWIMTIYKANIVQMASNLAQNLGNTHSSSRPTLFFVLCVSRYHCTKFWIRSLSLLSMSWFSIHFSNLCLFIGMHRTILNYNLECLTTTFRISGHWKLIEQQLPLNKSRVRRVDAPAVFYLCLQSAGVHVSRLCNPVYDDQITQRHRHARPFMLLAWAAYFGF
jgi:hypothetical protein